MMTWGDTAWRMRRIREALSPMMVCKDPAPGDDCQLVGEIIERVDELTRRYDARHKIELDETNKKFKEFVDDEWEIVKEFTKPVRCDLSPHDNQGNSLLSATSTTTIMRRK